MLMLGIAMTFAPEELLAYGGDRVHGAAVLSVQAAGALYLGFAVLNWMAKDNLIGGIYSKPVALGNFTQFLVLAIALSKAAIAYRSAAAVLFAAVYLVFAIWFGRVVFTTPKSIATGSAGL